MPILKIKFIYNINNLCKGVYLMNYKSFDENNLL